MNGLLRLFSKGIVFVLFVAVAGWALKEQSCKLGVVDFEGPISVLEVVSLSDGGSMDINFQDRKGRFATLQRVGSLDIDSTRQKMYVVRWFKFFPVRCSAPKGSKVETTVHGLFRTWLADRLTPKQEDMLKRGDIETLRSAPYDVLGVYELTHWIERRI
jgi:hypothetical protein